jgi:structural maintenance of chromosome 4
MIFGTSADKTADFSNQIEVHQRELEPWTAKISEKQAEVDVATSERDLLAKKATGMRDAITEAEDALEKLREGGEGKVRDAFSLLLVQAGQKAVCLQRLYRLV